MKETYERKKTRLIGKITTTVATRNLEKKTAFLDKMEHTNNNHEKMVQKSIIKKKVNIKRNKKA